MLLLSSGDRTTPLQVALCWLIRTKKLRTCTYPNHPRDGIRHFVIQEEPLTTPMITTHPTSKPTPGLPDNHASALPVDFLALIPHPI